METPEMRMTKFRGLTKDGKWIYGYLFKSWDIIYILWGETNGNANKIEVDPDTVTQSTGFALDDRELYAKDIIRFKYEDRIEEAGFGYCTGVIELENGAFVVKEIVFDNYDWTFEHKRPILLYDWLKDADCEYIGNVFENSELLKID